MKKLPRFYRYLSILSIDVSVGAVCSSIWFADFFGVKPEPYALLSLGLTVWIIYTTDHLLDARSTATMASAQRHQYHQLHFSKLIMILVGAVVFDALLMPFIVKEVFSVGLILFSLVMMYLVFNRWLGFLKEFLVSVFYCGGVLLPILSWTHLTPSVDEGVVVTSFFVTVWINVLLFSWFDRDADTLDGHRSFATIFGLRKTYWFIHGLFILQVILLGIVAYYSLAQMLVLLVMNSTLFFLFVKEKVFSKNENFRLVGDAIFLFPLIDFLLGRIL